MLDKLRLEIDSINDEMLALFQRRMAVSLDIAKEKQRLSSPVRDEKREQAILNAIAQKAQPEIQEYALKLFECLMALSRDYQQQHQPAKQSAVRFAVQTAPQYDKNESEQRNEPQ